MTGRLLRALAAISGAVLFLIMCLVSYAVFRRYVMNDPVLGDAEIVQIGMSLVVMMAMLVLSRILMLMIILNMMMAC